MQVSYIELNGVTVGQKKQNFGKEQYNYYKNLSFSNQRFDSYN